MSVFADTTNHENGDRGDSRIAPTGGGYFQRNDSKGGLFSPQFALTLNSYLIDSQLRSHGREYRLHDPNALLDEVAADVLDTFPIVWAVQGI